MEEEALKELYQEYLDLVFEISEYEDGEKQETRDLALPRFVIEYDGNDSLIKDSDGKLISVIKNKYICETGYPGLFGVKSNNGGAFDNFSVSYYIDFNDRRVCPLRGRFNTSKEYTYGISWTRLGRTHYYFYNDATGAYDTLLYKPLVFEYEFENGAYTEFIGQMTIFMENQYYKLFIDDDGKIFLYRKSLGTYDELAYNKTDKQSGNPERDFIALDINFDKNIMKINDNYYYMTPFDVIDISGMMKNKKWSRSIRISPVKEEIMPYELFKTKMKKDENFWKLLVSEIKELKQKKYIEDLEKAKEIQEQEEILRKTKRAKELWELILGAMKELKELGDLSIVGRIKVDEDLLFIKVGDHLELNPYFISFLSLIDFTLISFKNVKVSELDFSGSNALIDPQIVYNKDMSRGNYSGLDFNAASFKDVNISGSVFTDSLMDFTNFTEAKKDDDTVIERHYSF